MIARLKPLPYYKTPMLICYSQSCIFTFKSKIAEVLLQGCMLERNSVVTNGDSPIYLIIAQVDRWQELQIYIVWSTRKLSEQGCRGQWNHLVEETGVNQSNKNNMTPWRQMLLHIVKGLEYIFC